jgi:hypothetical protein
VQLHHEDYLMSEVEAPRDEATGQLKSAEPLYGLAGVEADAGYIARADHVPANDTDSYGSDEESLRALARKKWGDSPTETIDRKLIILDTGEPAPENWSQTVEQAATDLTNVHRWEKEIYDNEHLAKVAEDVDKARAEKIKGNPKPADHYGVELEANKAPAKEETAEEPYVEPADGQLHPEVEKALKHPQVRQAIAEEFSRAESVKAEYSQGLQIAHDFGQAAFMAIVPELQGLPPDQIEQGLQILAQVEPQRYQAAMETLQRVGALQQARAQQEQQRAAVERQQVETWAKAEDARLKTMGIEITNEVANEVADYAKSLGIERETLGRAMVDHPILRSAEVQAMMVAAAKFHALQKAPAKAIPKPVPSVQKPGVARSAGDRDASEIMSLRQKATATGSVEDAYKLYKARLKARG